MHANSKGTHTQDLAKVLGILWKERSAENDHAHVALLGLGTQRLQGLCDFVREQRIIDDDDLGLSGVVDSSEMGFG